MATCLAIVRVKDIIGKDCTCCGVLYLSSLHLSVFWYLTSLSSLLFVDIFFSTTCIFLFSFLSNYLFIPTHLINLLLSYHFFSFNSFIFPFFLLSYHFSSFHSFIDSSPITSPLFLLSSFIGALPAVRVDSDIDGNGVSISKSKASKHQKAGPVFVG